MKDKKDDLEGLTVKLRNAKDERVREQVWNEIFPHLKKIARNRIAASGRRGEDSPTELVNTLYPALQRALEKPENRFENRAYFFSYAATAMRNHLAAEARREAKRRMTEELSDENFSAHVCSPALRITLGEVLGRLEKRYPRAVRAFELRVYLEHPPAEIMELMAGEYKTPATLAADLTKIRNLLKDSLGDPE